MAKVMVPVCSIQYEEGDTYPLEAVDVLYMSGFMDDDCYTSTMRVSVPHETERGDIRQALRQKLPRDEADRLIKLLDDNNWDVSFFVDAYEG
jgi:hypothetical protein